MGEPHQVGVGARRIDDDEVVAALDGADRLGESGEFLGFDLVEPQSEAARDTLMHRDFQLDAGALGPIAPIVDVMGEAFLARIEVDRRDALA